MQGFLNEGATVHFCSRTAADVDRAAAEFSSGSNGTGEAHGATVDVSQSAQIQTWVASVAAAHAGRIDVVVSNVSALAVANTPENWDATFATDVRGMCTLVEAATPYLKRFKGCIVNISSVSGRYVDFTAPSAYGPIKAALVHYTSQLAHTLAKDGVRANSVSPGNIYVEDGIWGDIERKTPEFFAEQLKANPMGRMGKPEEVADAVVWLASERASFVNGTNLLVDGAVSPDVQF